MEAALKGTNVEQFPKPAEHQQGCRARRRPRRRAGAGAHDERAADDERAAHAHVGPPMPGPSTTKTNGQAEPGAADARALGDGVAAALPPRVTGDRMAARRGPLRAPCLLPAGLTHLGGRARGPPAAASGARSPRGARPGRAAPGAAALARRAAPGRLPHRAAGGATPRCGASAARRSWSPSQRRPRPRGRGPSSPGSVRLDEPVLSRCRHEPARGPRAGHRRGPAALVPRAVDGCSRRRFSPGSSSRSAPCGAPGRRPGRARALAGARADGAAVGRPLPVALAVVAVWAWSRDRATGSPGCWPAGLLAGPSRRSSSSPWRWCRQGGGGPRGARCGRHPRTASGTGAVGSGTVEPGSWAGAVGTASPDRLLGRRGGPPARGHGGWPWSSACGGGGAGRHPAR